LAEKLVIAVVGSSITRSAVAKSVNRVTQASYSDSSVLLVSELVSVLDSELVSLEDVLDSVELVSVSVELVSVSVDESALTLKAWED
jgi:hypothetical protein